MENKVIEALFNDFINTPNQGGELGTELHRISRILDDQISAGTVDCETVADYEYAATKYGYYAGFKAALDLLNHTES